MPQAVYCRLEALTRSILHGSYEVMGSDKVVETLPSFETHPSKYRHWKLTFENEIATLSMDVKEDEGLRANDYVLKQNSYDLGVDIELNAVFFDRTLQVGIAHLGQ